MKVNFKKIREAATDLTHIPESAGNSYLKILSRVLKDNKKGIIEANKIDVARARKGGLPQAFIQRLVLDSYGIEAIQTRIKSLTSLKSGLGRIIQKNKSKDGLILQKVRVPLGVLLVIYESRPEVTIDVATLCIKSGNVVILKGGSEARNTNKVLYQCIQVALKKARLPHDAVQMIENRNQVKEMLKMNNDIDLIIARGGYDMVKSVMENSKIPVLAHAAGGARIFIDKSADLKIAEKIILNAKISKPSACNSLDTIVIHQAIAKKFLPRILPLLSANGVKIVNNDWGTESLGLTVGVNIVEGVFEAVKFINHHSKKHSEGIVATDKKVIKYFTNSVDSAAIFVNCSTRLHDGYVFGLGAEMGIATGKLHARGPVGLKELTTYKWEIYGKGQVRE